LRRHGSGPSRSVGSSCSGELFETVRIGGGRIVSVKPRPEVLPLVAITVGSAEPNDWRSRPGSEQQYRTFAGVVIEGIEDLADIADTVA
jgi:hypothetical protein